MKGYSVNRRAKLEVWAVEVTTSNVGDAPMLPELLGQIPPSQEIGSVTADGAYDTRQCHDAIAARGAHVVIPPRKKAKPWKPTSAGAIVSGACRASGFQLDGGKFQGRSSSSGLAG